MVVLGGDGTLLAAAKVAAPLGIPILPINMPAGSLRWFSDQLSKADEMYSALEDTLACRLPLSERVMLDVELIREGARHRAADRRQRVRHQ